MRFPKLRRNPSAGVEAAGGSALGAEHAQDREAGGDRDAASQRGLVSERGIAHGGPVTDQEFRQIYDAHFVSVWHALRRLSVAENDLMDATQNVFFVVYRKLPEFEGRAQLRTWIFQICRRVASDYRRSAPVRREVVTDITELTERQDGNRVASSGAERAARVKLARTVLDKLSDVQREVFILYELEGLSGEEIAKRLELPVGTVRSRLRLARRMFRQEVANLMEMPAQRDVG